VHGRRSFVFVFAIVAFLATSAGRLDAQLSVATPSMDAWLGSWEFSECWPTTDGSASNCTQYQLRISRHGRQTIAALDMDGFQVMSRFRCEVEQTATGIRVVFAGIRDPGLFDDAYKAGDELFDLSAKGGKVLTVWRKMTPDLDKDKRTGVHFVKVK